MPTTERFLATLEPATPASRGTILTTLKPFKVVLQRARSSSTATQLEFTGANDPPPSGPKVWLQIWEVDKFESTRRRSGGGGGGGAGAGGGGAGGGGSNDNDFLIEIPGSIKKKSASAHNYEFRVLGAPTPGSGTNMGSFKLKLKDPTGQDWQSDGHDLVVAILGESEDEVDLGCVLKDAAGDRSSASNNWATGACLHAINMDHVLGSQLHEGGLTVGFYGDLNTQAQKDFGNSWGASHRGVTSDEIHASQDGRAEVGKTIYHIINDNEFIRAGADFARKFHSVGLIRDELVIASTPYTSLGQITGALPQIRQKVHQEFLHGSGEQPKIKRLAIMTHGINTAVRTGQSESNWTGIGGVPALADAIAPHLTDDVVVTLYACSAGKGPNDASFGGAPDGGRALGDGSFGCALHAALVARGRTNAAVWGHTTPGHTTGNPTLRAYSSSGACDLVWMIQSPPATRNARATGAVNFIRRMSAKRDEIMHAATLHPGDEVQRALGSGGGSGGGSRTA